MKEPKKGELKSLAQDAKTRLTKGYWDGIKAEREAMLLAAQSQGKDAKGVILYYSEKCSREIAAMHNPIDRREEEMYLRVKQALDTDGTIANPTAVMMDKKFMETLSETEKQRYLFSLMGKYSEFRTRYEHEKQLLDGIAPVGSTKN